MRYLLVLLINNILLAANLFASGSVQLYFKGGQASMGEKLLCPVTVSNFNDIVSMQGTINFDASGVELTDIVQFGLENMSITNFGTNLAGQGYITLSWIDNDLTGESLSDNTILFVLEFTFKSVANFTTTLDFNDAIIPVELIKSDYKKVNLITHNTQIGTGPAISSDVHLKFASVQVDSGKIVSVPLTVVFATSNVLSLQGTIRFDPSELELSGIGQFNIPGLKIGNFGLSDISQGIITFSWNDPTLNGITLNENSNLFSIDFKVIGNLGDKTTVSITSTPLEVEFISGTYYQLNVSNEQGIVEIVNSVIVGNLTLYSDYTELVPDQAILIPVQVKNFSDIVSMQGSIRFSANELSFQSIIPGDVAGLTTANFGITNVTSGEISFSWNEPSLQPVTLSDEDTLFLLEFEVETLAMPISTISFTDVPVRKEFINSLLMEVPVYTEDIILIDKVIPNVTMVCPSYWPGKAGQDTQLTSLIYYGAGQVY
jgi:hypothetical protein